MRKRRDQVAAANLQRVQAEPVRRAIHQPFHRRGDDRARDAAIGRHRAGVGGDRPRPAPIGAERVRPRQFADRHQRLDPAGNRIDRVGADIAEAVGFQCQELAGGIERAAQSQPLVARMRRGGQVFGPVLDPGDAAREAPRRPDRDDVFRDQRGLLPEAAADIRRDDAKIGFRHSQDVGDAGAHHVRRLGRSAQGHTSGRRIECGDGAARFERHRRLPARLEGEFDNLMRRCKGRRDIAGFEAGVDHGVVRGYFVDQRRAGRERLVEIDDRGFRFDLYFDLLGEIFRRRGGVRDHCGDRLADMGHTRAGKDRLRDRDVFRPQ